MVLHSYVQQSPGSHFAVVDSGTSMQILQYRLFTSQLSEDHTAVSGIRRSTSTATQDTTSTAYARLIHLQPLSSPTVTEIFIPCDTLNTPAKLSYWEPKQDCCHTVIQISSFHSSKTYL